VTLTLSSPVMKKDDERLPWENAPVAEAEPEAPEARAAEEAPETPEACAAEEASEATEACAAAEAPKTPEARAAETAPNAEAKETDKNPAENEFSEILKQRIYRQEEDEE